MGDVAGAIEAIQMAMASGRPGTESAAWATVQLGDLYFNSGRINEAAEHYQAALRSFPGYHVALAALGKARAAQGGYVEAIQLYQRAIGIVPQPVTLSALGDLYAKAGQKEQAQLQYDTVELIARLAAINQQIYNRELALFYADHNLKPAEALALAAGELEVRQDIYGYDALAWALYKNDRPREAAAAMASAMKLGTQNPNLYYHAGMIYYRLREWDKARVHLEHALALNPHFSILFEDEARQTLSGLQGRPASTGGTGVTTP
jgi:tetratricopeptide (TPR) repeat protein